MYFSAAFLAVLPIFVGICMVNCQRISQKFIFLFVIMATFGMVILSIDVLGQYNMQWKHKGFDYQQGIGLMVLLLISYCSFILVFFLFIKRKSQTGQIKKRDFSPEETQMSQQAQYEGARPSKVNYPVAISNRLFKDSEIGKDLPCQHCNMITMGEMVCYQEFCPECGRIPPNRKRQEYWFLQAINGSQKLMVAQIFYGSSVPDDFPTIVTCMSKNEQEKFRYTTKKFQNVKKSVKFEETGVPNGSDESFGSQREDILQFKNGNAVLMKNVKETFRDCCNV